MIDDKDYAVEREDDGEYGRYFINLAPGIEGEMTYRHVGPNTIAIDHTDTPPAFRGKGVAETLVLKAIADARAEGTKIVPLCSYVVAQFKRHPEWEDLRAQ
jgi:predicted GNAT family acetyltransferase